MPCIHTGSPNALAQHLQTACTRLGWWHGSGVSWDCNNLSGPEKLRGIAAETGGTQFGGGGFASLYVM